MREPWDGGEWQAHCCRLLGARYGEEVQIIPDRVGGDGGLEAFRLDCGVVYQCYAPQDAFTVQAQTDGQKRKIRDDIHKLVSKPTEVAALLGKDYRISRWVLLTPEFDDKELIKYARAKAAETRSPVRPDWCAEEFEIVVGSDRDLFSVELSKLTAPVSIINLNIPDVTEGDAYASVDEGVAYQLTEKLKVNLQLRVNEEQLSGYRSSTLCDYVYGKRQIEILEDRYAAVYALVQRRAGMTLRRLQRRLPAVITGAIDLEALTQDLASSFAADAPALTRMACDDLANYFVASWWISCPLRFKEAG